MHPVMWPESRRGAMVHYQRAGEWQRLTLVGETSVSAVQCVPYSTQGTGAVLPRCSLLAALSTPAHCIYSVKSHCAARHRTLF